MCPQRGSLKLLLNSVIWDFALLTQAQRLWSRWKISFLTHFFCLPPTPVCRENRLLSRALVSSALIHWQWCNRDRCSRLGAVSSLWKQSYILQLKQLLNEFWWCCTVLAFFITYMKCGKSTVGRYIHMWKHMQDTVQPNEMYTAIVRWRQHPCR